MYILLKKGKLKYILIKALKKAGTGKRFSEILQIPRSKIWSYQNKNIALTKERLQKIADYAGYEIKQEDIEKELQNNWRQIIGGKNCVKDKEQNGTLNQQLKQSRSNIKKTLADWHKEMKSKDIKKYYLSQYEKFKKIAGYKHITLNEEKVRNSFEKQIANILKKQGIIYQYEPLIKAKDRYFFPDFLIKNKIILECTMWRGYDKAAKLKDKIDCLKDKYKIYVIIPPKLEKYYSSIKNNLIIGLDNFEQLIKTF